MIYKSKIEAPQQEQKTVETETEEGNRVLEEMTNNDTEIIVTEEGKTVYPSYDKEWEIERAPESRKPREVSKYETSFVLSAYYSPLPGQSYYTTGSYESDKRLNGEGYTTASWKAVKYGMIAADKKYPFWTKIHLEWLWDFVVEDRWWAIKGNRIDVYMWEGEEALNKALQFGKKTVRGNLINN